MNPDVCRTTVDSASFGPVVLFWTELDRGPVVTRVLLSRPGVPATDRASAVVPAARVCSRAPVEDLANRIAGYLEGEDAEFPLALVDLDSCPAFQQRVLRAEHAIPRGSVSTYQLIGAHIGVPTGARAVGNALARNPFPLLVPCHRAVRSDRQLGGFQGGSAMKRTLLEREKVPFDEAGRVEVGRFHYQEAVRHAP